MRYILVDVAVDHKQYADNLDDMAVVVADADHGHDAVVVVLVAAVDGGGDGDDDVGLGVADYDYDYDAAAAAGQVSARSDDDDAGADEVVEVGALREIVGADDRDVLVSSVGGGCGAVAAVVVRVNDGAGVVGGVDDDRDDYDGRAGLAVGCPTRGY